MSKAATATFFASAYSSGFGKKKFSNWFLMKSAYSVFSTIFSFTFSYYSMSYWSYTTCFLYFFRFFLPRSLELSAIVSAGAS